MLIGIIQREGRRGKKILREKTGERTPPVIPEVRGMELSGQTDLGQESGELRMGQVDPQSW